MMYSFVIAGFVCALTARRQLRPHAAQRLGTPLSGVGVFGAASIFFAYSRIRCSEKPLTLVLLGWGFL